MLASHGVNRISLGVQSFSSAKLALLERDHRSEQIATAFEAARRSMRSVSLDLIFGAPGETVESWQHDLQLALNLAPDHVSTYGLTFERGTSFWSRLRKEEFAQVGEEDERQMYLAGIELLARAGFEHYEVSNFAKPGHRCRHNEVYWSGGTYHAAGPGAARYVGGRRETNHRSTTSYLSRVLADCSPIAESETLSPEESARERLVFGLRRLEGVESRRLHGRNRFRDRSDCRSTAGQVRESRLTRGHRFADSLIARRITCQRFDVARVLMPLVVRKPSTHSVKRAERIWNGSARDTPWAGRMEAGASRSGTAGRGEFGRTSGLGASCGAIVGPSDS